MYLIIPTTYSALILSLKYSRDANMYLIIPTTYSALILSLNASKMGSIILVDEICYTLSTTVLEHVH